LIPNLLSAFRLLLIPFILLALAQGLRVQALGLIFLSVATDLVDGWVARRFGQVTDLGKILDPLGDKVSTGALSLYLAWVGKLPWWIAGVVVGKDLAILFAGLAFLGRKHEVPVSDRWGKVAVLVSGALLVSCAMDWKRLVEPLIILTLITVAISIVSYSRKYIGPRNQLKEGR
jgi:CDP-diacylglycerol--glycerol-3-phosphate 3-phosphatidyltransferase